MLGTALPADPIANPASLIPLSPATWTFQLASGPNQGSSETDILQTNPQPAPDAQWQYTAGQSTIYDLGTTGRGSIVSPSEQDLTQGVLTRVYPVAAGAAPGNAAGRFADRLVAGQRL